MYDDTSQRLEVLFYVLFHEIQWLYIINITDRFTYSLTSPRSSAVLKLRPFTSLLTTFVAPFLLGGRSSVGSSTRDHLHLLMPVAASLPTAFSHAPVCLVFESMRFVPY